MKKIVLCVMATFLSLTFIPMQLSAANGDEPSTLVDPKSTEPSDSAKVNTLELRIDEISAMDMENLSSSDKKELKKEVRSIKKELKAIGGGVYLSGGAIILIVLLIILL